MSAITLNISVTDITSARRPNSPGPNCRVINKRTNILTMPESPLMMIVELVFLIRGRNARKICCKEVVIAVAAYAAQVNHYNQSTV
jgi:hypothetical protein